MSTITYKELLTSFRKGLRNSNWKRLRRLEQALVRAALWYTKGQGVILNETLVSELSTLVDRLKATKGAHILKRGYKKASALLSKGESVFAWAPSLRKWLKDAD
jgi:hypothetical protein